MTRQPVLPNFLIIGAMRSGTTALFAALREHPDVFAARDKELRFFDLHFDRGLGWYERAFVGSEGAGAVGEATQTYMYDAQALERMAATLPDARLIAILRDPVERAYSHYWLNRARGREPLTFEAAIDAEPDRLRDGAGSERFFYSYVDRGRYVEQLERVCALYDRSRLHVLLFDDLRDRPAEAFAGVCRFLGVDERFLPPTLGRPVNEFQGFRSLRVRAWTLDAQRRGLRRAGNVMGALNRRREAYPSMSERTRGHLGDVFRQGNMELAAWLGRELTQWSGSPDHSRDVAR